MSTLSNVTTRGGEANPPSVRLAPETIPDARSSRTGVSVRYVPTQGYKWYVFRASYGREDKASDCIVEDGNYTYIAKRYVRKSVKGARQKILESLIPNLLFVYTTADKADTYIKETPELHYLTYYYNHFEQDADQKNPLLAISLREMENFIRATSNCSEHLCTMKCVCNL